MILGRNLFCHPDVTVHWRMDGSGDLHQLSPLHPSLLEELNAQELVAEKVGRGFQPSWKLPEKVNNI